MVQQVTLRRSVVVGAITGLLFTVWAAIVFARAGTAPFAAAHTSLTRVSLTYLSVGTVAGLLIGGLSPLARSTATCYVVALPAAAAVAAGILLMHAEAWRPWDAERWGLYGVLLVVGTLVIGNQMNVRRVAGLRAAETEGQPRT